MFLGLVSCSNEEREAQTPDQLNNRPSVPIMVNEVTIGNQIWMNKNLNVSRYRNGDIIAEVTDQSQWESLSTGAWCYYENNSANGPVYGKLYNWYAVNDPRGLAPQGWHLPSDAEWTTLTNSLGGLNFAGGKMKLSGIQYWQSPNTNATNSSGFMGLPGGDRASSGTFYNIGLNAYWWSSSEFSPSYAWYRVLYYNDGAVVRINFFKKSGLSVRCVKD